MFKNIKKFVLTLLIGFLFIGNTSNFAFADIASQVTNTLSPEYKVIGMIENFVNLKMAIKYPESNTTVELIQQQIDEIVNRCFNDSAGCMDQSQITLRNLKADILLIQLQPLIETDAQGILDKLKNKTITYIDHSGNKNYWVDKLTGAGRANGAVDNLINTIKTKTEEKKKAADEKVKRRFLYIFFGSDSPLFLKNKENPNGVQLTDFEYTLLNFAFNLLFIAMFVVSLLIVITMSFGEKYNQRGYGSEVSGKFLRLRELVYLLLFILFVFSGMLGTVFFTIYFDMLKTILDSLFGGFGDVVKLR